MAVNEKEQFDTPILLITFNRPDYVVQSLSEIRKQQPEKLYIFQDGPREGNENDVVRGAEVRKLVKTMVDWPCGLHTNYQEKNLGCGLGPATAITWFFENEELGMIFEDDCVPHEDFFPYCKELLNKYKSNDDIAIIGGCNYGYDIKGGKSYDFGSGHHQTWGWASWRRVWKLFDYYLVGYGEKEFSKIIGRYYKPFRQRDYWNQVFKEVKKNQLNGSCWDYQFYFSLWKREMLAIYPRVNLVTNIGFGDDATHTTNQSNGMLSRETYPIIPLNHPDKIELNSALDDFMMRKFIIPYRYGMNGLKNLPYRLNSYLKYLVGHQGPWIKQKV